MADQITTLQAPSAAEHKPLSPQQLQAVVMEAAGAPRTEIARVAGVSTSTVKQWRTLDAYKAEVERLKNSYVEAAAGAMQRLRSEMIDGASAAIRKLKEALDAEDRKGLPAWQTRLRAAEILMEYGVEPLKEAAAADRAGTQAGGPTQAIQIVLNTEKGPPDPTTIING